MNTKISLIAVVLFLAIGCKNEPQNIDNDSSTEPVETPKVLGNYVTEEYSKRSEGYDWVAVSVTEMKANQLKISVRSRADLKKPTCTFDAVAEKVEDMLYQTRINGKIIRFEFDNSQVRIRAAKEEDEGLLYFYCSGGASIGGTYVKIDAPLDAGQIDQTRFSKVLNLQGVGFNVSSIKKDGQNTLRIFTFGLQARDYNETFTIEGEEVVNAEVEDLNSDGSPELFVYTQSVGSGSYGNVYAFSVNNMKSMSQVYFQPTAENTMINHGYMGHDEFSVVENTLAQRFPVYEGGDTNARPTGRTRYVNYRLVEGEAMRKLEVINIREYD